MAIKDIVSSIAIEQSKNKTLLNIIEFAEHSDFLNIKLFPVQKFVFKLIYGVELSDDVSDDPIIIRDDFNENELCTFTSEKDFLQWLYETKRINSLDVKNPMEIYFFIGRRGSKTTMISIMVAYMLYILLSNECPQEYFGVIKQSEVSVAVVSNNLKNAIKQSAEIGNMVYSSKWFKQYLVNPKEYASDGFKLKTKREILKPDEKVGKILVSVFAATPSVRGSNNIIIIMDEFHHFIDSDKSTKSNPLDEKLYDAITPSVAGFVHPNGTPAGKIMIATSPNGKKGMAYKKYKGSFETSDYLMLHMPSHWVNYKLAPSYLKSRYRASEAMYRQEFLADFVDSKSSFVKDPNKVYICEDLRLQNKPIGSSSTKYVVGLDPAMGNDSFAVAIGHWSEVYVKDRQLTDTSLSPYIQKSHRYILVLDYIGSITPEYGAPLNPDDIFKEISNILKGFNILKIGLDNWAKEFILDGLKKVGYRSRYIEEMTPTVQSNTLWAVNFKNLINDNQIIWSPFAIEKRYMSKDSFTETTFSEEVTSLEEKINGKFIKVEAPAGLHDDRYSAVSKVVTLALKYKDIMINGNSQDILKQKVNRTNNKRIIKQRTGRR